jgi:hypothetical protein
MSTQPINTESAPQWLSVKEFSALVNRPLRTVYEWVSDGTLHAFSIQTRREIGGRIWIQVTAYTMKKLRY